MRTLCLALLVASVALAGIQATPTKQKNKRLLSDLLGGSVLLGDLLGLGDVLDSLLSPSGLLGSLLNIKDDLIPQVFGPNGILGGLLDDLLGNEFIAGLLGDGVLGGLGELLKNVVAEVTAFVAELVEIVLAALDGVDLDSASAVENALSKIPCNKLCRTCKALPNVAVSSQCFQHCKASCKWAFK